MLIWWIQVALITIQLLTAVCLWFYFLLTKPSTDIESWLRQGSQIEKVFFTYLMLFAMVSLFVVGSLGFVTVCMNTYCCSSFGFILSLVFAFCFSFPDSLGTIKDQLFYGESRVCNDQRIKEFLNLVID